MILTAAWSGAALSRRELELLGAATQLAQSAGEEIAVVALGEEAAAAAGSAGRHGAARAYAFEGDLGACANEAYVEHLAELMRELEPTAVLLPADERGVEVAPRLAGRVGGTAVSQAVALEIADGSTKFIRPVFGGKALAAVIARRAPAVVTLRPGAFEPPAQTDASVAIECRDASGFEADLRRVKREVKPSGGAQLEDASVIVSGGRGMGGPEGFAQLEELAQLIGGSVGASLAAVDEGWVPQDRQVGLTGKTVRPDVYFAIGISGASQHLAGIGGAKAVVAVNADPDAPIFDAARLGVVMGFEQFVPAAIEECRKRGSS